MNEELMDFVEWLPNNSELFADMNVEAIIAQINNLASSDEGKETLEQLTKQYKSKEMGLFKKGGKLNYLLCLKKGGKVQDCGCGKKIEKAQGGSDGLRERGSVNAYDERYPEFNRDSTWSVVSTPNGPAYAKREARQSGLRGDEMRNAARSAIMARGVNRILPALDEVVIEDEPLELEDTFANLEVPTSLGITIAEPVKPITFREAFAAARKLGQTEFEWNGKRYNTRLSNSRPFTNAAVKELGQYGKQTAPYWETVAMTFSKK